MYLTVLDGQRISYETYGAKNGTPILFIHGGPGLGYKESDKRFFDPDKHFVILYDQRGSGNSQPSSISQNNLKTNLSDITALLDHLHIEAVHIFAGSWGATLAILYASSYHSRVKSMIIRGFFSATKSTIDILFRGAINRSAWQILSSKMTCEQRKNPLQYYHDTIFEESARSTQFAYDWTQYITTIFNPNASLEELNNLIKQGTIDKQQIRIMMHFAMNNFFLDPSDVYNKAANLSLPTIIIHGKYDLLCPIENAELLHKKMSNSQLIVVEGGHSSNDPAIEKALIEALKF